MKTDPAVQVERRKGRIHVPRLEQIYPTDSVHVVVRVSAFRNWRSTLTLYWKLYGKPQGGTEPHDIGGMGG